MKILQLLLLLALCAPLSAPAFADTVHLKNGSQISGDVREVENEPMVLVKVAGGHIIIPKNAIDRIERNTEQPKPAATNADRIETTHVVHFKNGAQLRGNLVSGDDDAMAYISVGGLGKMAIERSRIDRIEESAGIIEIPETPTITADTEPAPEALIDEEPAEPRVGNYTLSELADRLVARHKEIIAGLEYDPYLAATIDEHVRELGRHRTRNRVRAERHLKSIGPAVLPYLTPIANHPFSLPRRAVQRIVRDLGDIEGAPIAIAGLDDSDRFVRATAHEALVNLFPADAVRFKASWSQSRRRAVQRHYEEAWTERERQAILNTLREALGLE